MSVIDWLFTLLLVCFFTQEMLLHDYQLHADAFFFHLEISYCLTFTKSLTTYLRTLSHLFILFHLYHTIANYF